MSDVSANPREECVGMGDPLGLRNQGQGRGLEAIDLIGVNHMKPFGDEAGTLGFVVVLLLGLFVLQLLPEHDRGGLLALADLSPNLGPLLIGSPDRRGITG